MNDFSFQFRKKSFYDTNVCMHSFHPIMVDKYAAFFNCTPVGRASDSLMAPIKLFTSDGWCRSFISVVWPTEVQLVFFICSGGCLAPRVLHRQAAYYVCDSSFLFILVVIIIYLFFHDDSLTS